MKTGAALAAAGAVVGAAIGAASAVRSRGGDGAADGTSDSRAGETAPPREHGAERPSDTRAEEEEEEQDATGEEEAATTAEGDDGDSPESQAGESSESESDADREPEPEPGSPRALVRRAEQELARLTGREPEGVLGFERTDDGWLVQIEVVELKRIPETTDVLGVYDVELDGDGELRHYRRTSRYIRSSAGGGGS